MLSLPTTTEFNRRIPKQKFYENLTISPTLKKSFVDQIKVIFWRNKIASTTMNLAPGESVTEIEIFEIKLNDQNLDEAVLRQIDKEIPYHIVFLLEHEGKYQAWTAYKEATASGNNAFKVGTYYHTKWMDEEKLPLKIDGLNIDKVYENYVRQIAGNCLKGESNESLKESVERSAKRQQLEKEIEQLRIKIRKEKQLNKQIQLNAELKKIKKEMEVLI